LAGSRVRVPVAGELALAVAVELAALLLVDGVEDVDVVVESEHAACDASATSPRTQKTTRGMRRIVAYVHRDDG
jgi:hypothetical protein